MSKSSSKRKPRVSMAASKPFEFMLTKILIRQNVVSEIEMNRAIQEAASRNLPLRNTLTGLNICLEDEINWAISRDLGIPFVLLSSEMVEPEVAALFPLDLLQESQAVPIVDALGDVTLVMADPLDESKFHRAQEHYKGSLHRAVAPSGRVAFVLDLMQKAIAPNPPFQLETGTKDTSGVASAYGMLVAARSRGANRILVRPSGDGLEAVFRLERGWVVYQVWSREEALSIVTRCRIMMGLAAISEQTHEQASMTARILEERISVEAVFIQDSGGSSVDIQMYPVISSPSLGEIPSLAEPHRKALLGLFTAHRATGVIIVNSTDQRQRYRMISGLMATLVKRNLDVMTIEERRYLDIPGVRRFEARIDSPQWEEIVQQECEVLALADAPFWRWKALVGSTGAKLLILGLDLANTWLAFRAFAETLKAPAIAADRLRAIWSGKRVDLVCTVCGGRKRQYEAGVTKAPCPECDGYGHAKGADLFEVLVPDAAFRKLLSGKPNWNRLHSDLTRIACLTTIDTQLLEGIERGEIFNARDGNE